MVLFDCRVLHFGCANRASDWAKIAAADANTDANTDADTDADGGDRDRWWWRPLLYANVTQRWFEDKKNWETTRLFTDADHAAIAREAAAQSEQ